MNPRFLELKHNNEILTSSKKIEQYLSTTDFIWLNDCELENCKIEIKDNLLHFNFGIIYYGIWNWGIMNGGEFRSGIWKGGIINKGDISKNVEILKIVDKR